MTCFVHCSVALNGTHSIVIILALSNETTPGLQYTLANLGTGINSWTLPKSRYDCVPIRNSRSPITQDLSITCNALAAVAGGF